jgi:ornithine cyclodeaminase
MITIDRALVANLVPYPLLIQQLEQIFISDCRCPSRTHHEVSLGGTAAGTLLLMPAWTSRGFLGVKIAAVLPGNHSRGLPSVTAQYLLMDVTDGEWLALIDGGELTARRTAATSALAAGRLARPDAERLLIVGTGRLARHLARAHASVRPGLRVEVWGRRFAAAVDIADELRREGIEAVGAPELAPAVARADIISCATLSHEPLIRGQWLKPGVHLDLVGSFTPAMREADDEALRGAIIYCDTRDALHESGDLAEPLEHRVIEAAQILELAALLRGELPGRTSAEERTVFKSVGCALEDLAAAMVAYEAHQERCRGA